MIMMGRQGGKTKAMAEINDHLKKHPSHSIRIVIAGDKLWVCDTCREAAE